MKFNLFKTQAGRPCITAYFQTGDNKADHSGPPEIRLSSATSSQVSEAHVVWDPKCHEGKLTSGPKRVQLEVPKCGSGKPVSWKIDGSTACLHKTDYGNIKSVTVSVHISKPKLIRISGAETSARLSVIFISSDGDSDCHDVFVSHPFAMPNQVVVTPKSGFAAVELKIAGTVDLIDFTAIQRDDNFGYIYVFTDPRS